MASIVEPLGSMAAAWRAFAGTMNCLDQVKSPPVRQS
jgi:hypothetical protein